MAAGSSAATSAPRVELRSLAIEKLGFERLSLAFELAVANPGPTTLRLAQLEYVLSIDGLTVARDEVAASGQVLPRASATLRIPVEVSWGGISDIVILLVRGRQVPYRVRGALSFSQPDDPVGMRIGFQQAGRLRAPDEP
jgi:LEA14-like dessication related protein